MMSMTSIISPFVKISEIETRLGMLQEAEDNYYIIILQ